MNNKRYLRQSFLGERAQEKLEQVIIGVVGLGGGGSHIVQQLAHIGVLHYRLYDADIVEDSNLNRLVGATDADIQAKTLKAEIARRVISSVQPHAKVLTYTCRWQENPEPLRGCDIIFGCVDSFGERRELEACARRYLIPYIDIGMDIHCVGDDPPRMGGQVIVSMPGGPCMYCLGFLNERTLAQEAAKYGEAGDRPQVIWANGILASTAVGIAIDLLTDWTLSLRSVIYLSYDGNVGTLQPHVRLNYLDQKQCVHYPGSQLGDPVYVPV